MGFNLNFPTSTPVSFTWECPPPPPGAAMLLVQKRRSRAEFVALGNHAIESLKSGATDPKLEVLTPRPSRFHKTDYTRDNLSCRLPYCLALFENSFFEVIISYSALGLRGCSGNIL